MTLTEFMQERLAHQREVELEASSWPDDGHGGKDSVLRTVRLNIEMLEWALSPENAKHATIQRTIARGWHWHRDYDQSWGKPGDPL